MFLYKQGSFATSMIDGARVACEVCCGDQLANFEVWGSVCR